MFSFSFAVATTFFAAVLSLGVHSTEFDGIAEISLPDGIAEMSPSFLSWAI